MPTYSPANEADTEYPRTIKRLTPLQIADRLEKPAIARRKPWVYLDAIDSVLNTRPDIHLVVADGKSTESIREGISRHHAGSKEYSVLFYPEKMSQWVLFNDIFKKYATQETEYFVYTSSDVIWHMDWIGEAIREFEKNPKIQIIFPTVTSGDPNLPCQVAQAPEDKDSFQPPYQIHAKAPVLNGYVMIFRMDFLRTYGGYPTLFRNCYTESFLHYLCEAIGGEQRLMPRGNCYHHGTVDIWEENGSFYHYNEDLMPFQTTMNKLQMTKAMGGMTPEFLKELLWKKET